CLKAAGAKLVIVLQRKSIRQEYAKRAGADVVLDPNEVNIAEEVKKLTNGLGVDVAFETTGAQIGFDTGIDSLKFEGTMVITSIWEKGVTFNPNALVFTEKKIVGTLAYRHEFQATMAQMKDGRIKAEGYVTKKIHLDDIVEEGFGALTGPEKKKHVKILVTPDKDLIS
ncbi:zinc-binding dehydrogenase, partial [Clostridium butyricum]